MSAEDDRSVLAGTEVHYLAAPVIGDELKIFVGHCGTDGIDRPGVLYLTDANGFFGATVDVVRGLQLASHLPPLLIVGIGYRAGGLADTLGSRTRDLTPSADPDFAAPDGVGGADRLLAFIHTDLQPWVVEQFGADASDATYFGHSFGGLFGTHVLFQRPATFRRYVLGSPSLWWDRGIMFAAEGRYAEQHRDLPARVFFGVGGDEDRAGRLREDQLRSPTEQAAGAVRPIDLVDDVGRMVDQLERRRYPNLALGHAVFPGEFHVTVPFLSMSRGLRFVFDAPR